MRAILAAATIAVIVSAQASTSFEAASVKRNLSGDRGIRVRTPPDGGLVVTNTTLGDLIRLAYQVQEYQLAGGPAWLETARFDIVATGNGEASETKVVQKIRTLLADRFRLSVHTERREMPVYAIVLARPDRRLGAQLRPSAADCATLPGCGVEGQRTRLSLTGQPMSRLAEMLSFRVGRMVVDGTGLGGTFDMALTWSTDDVASDTAPSLFTAMQEQLGLRLDPQRDAVDVIVIDHAEPPTED
jgi:uncharacterized protein (TIGR03435 family)